MHAWHKATNSREAYSKKTLPPGLLGESVAVIISIGCERARLDAALGGCVEQVHIVHVEMDRNLLTNGSLRARVHARNESLAT
jgi:hypothetical protein